MSSPNLPPGAFITSLGGKRCTAIPKKAGGGGGGQQQTSTTTAAATTTAAPSTTTVQEPPKTSTTQVQAPPPPPPAAEPPQTSTTAVPPPVTSTSTTSLPTTLQPPPTQAPPAQTSTAVVVPPPPLPPPSSVAETSTTAAKLPATSLPPDAPPSASQTVPPPAVAAPDVSTSTSQAFVPPIIAIPSYSPSSQAQPTDTALRTSEAQTQTADSTAPTATDASPIADATTAFSTSIATSSPTLNDDLATGNGRNAGNAAVVTTVGSSVFTITPAASQTAGADDAALETNTGPSTHTTQAVVGGVVGGVAFVAIIVFIFWFVRRRLNRKRRSTLLTPLGGPENGFGNFEKKPYIFSRDSIGPTPLSEKFRATFGQNLRNLRGRVKRLVVRSPSPNVNLDRGNSQFLDGSISVSDSGRSGRDGSPPRKGGFLGFFSKSGRESGSGWRFGRNRGKQDGGEDLFANTRGMKDTQRGRSSQPDFLTLLNMDDKQLAEQANIKRKTLAGKNRRSSSAGSADHFLGGLGLSFGSTNPFLDSNAMPHDSAKPAPLSNAAPGEKNPFSDANAIRPPTQSKQIGPPSTYTDNVRRSRGQSVTNSRPPSSQQRAGTMYRDSGDSVESFQTRRNKFRSDPFDLDRPELLSSSASASSAYQQSGPPTARTPATPGKAHTRASSYSSRYSSGVNTLEDFGDPGPDIGAATNRYAPPPLTTHKKNGSSGQVSVGKAY